MKTPKKGAPKKAADIYKRLREKPISERMRKFLEEYKKTEAYKQRHTSKREPSDDKCF